MPRPIDGSRKWISVRAGAVSEVHVVEALCKIDSFGPARSSFFGQPGLQCPRCEVSLLRVGDPGDLSITRTAEDEAVDWRVGELPWTGEVGLLSPPTPRAGPRSAFPLPSSCAALHWVHGVPCRLLRVSNVF